MAGSARRRPCDVPPWIRGDAVRLCRLLVTLGVGLSLASGMGCAVDTANLGGGDGGPSPDSGTPPDAPRVDAPRPAACTSGSDCPSGRCLQGQCVGNRSVPAGGVCTGNLDCQSGLCETGLCAASPTPSPAVCSDASQCPSGTCQDGLCQGDHSLPNGQSCVGNADCRSGLCETGVCQPTAASPPGSCGTAAECAAGSACVQGQCMGQGTVGTGGFCTGNLDCVSQLCLDQMCQAAGGAPDGGLPDFCSGSGSPINLGNGSVNTCSGSVAQRAFRYGLCSCTNVQSGNLTLDSFDSSRGGVVGDEAPLGVNGTLEVASGHIDVGGVAWIGGAGGLTVGGNQTVSRNLLVAGPLDVQRFSVGGDAFVQGDIQGTLAVTGTLHVPASANIGKATAGAVTRQAVSVDVPCDCLPSHLVDIAGLVAPRAAANDNATIGLSADALAGGGTTLDLPCGRYYLSRIDSGNPVLNVHGRVALFIGGDVTATSGFTINLDSGAEIDVLVAGNFSVHGALAFGSATQPTRVRTYIGGTQVSVESSASFAGFFYAPFADFTAGARLTLAGGIFARSYVSQANTTIHYDVAIRDAGAACGAPGEGGVGTTTCTDRSSCATAQACRSGVCAPCTAAAQCGSGQDCVNGSCVTPPPPGICTAQAQCPGQQACVSGQCTYCTADGQCQSGQRCLNGSCTAPPSGTCSGTSMCPASQVCLAGTCAPCSDSSQCPAAQSCLNGSCDTTVSTCSGNTDCTAGQVCGSTGMCEPCVSDSQCDAGQLCANGTCVGPQL
jgi:hypothetical protein